MNQSFLSAELFHVSWCVNLLLFAPVVQVSSLPENEEALAPVTHDWYDFPKSAILFQTTSLARTFFSWTFFNSDPLDCDTPRPFQLLRSSYASCLRSHSILMSTYVQFMRTL